MIADVGCVAGAEWRRAQVFRGAGTREDAREEGKKELPRSSRLAGFLPLMRALPTHASFTPAPASQLKQACIFYCDGYVLKKEHM